PRPYLTSSLAPRGGRGPRRVRGLVVVHGVWCSWHVASPRRHLGSTTVTSPSRAGAPAALCPLRTRGYGNDHRTPRNARVFSLGRHPALMRTSLSVPDSAPHTSPGRPSSCLTAAFGLSGGTDRTVSVPGAERTT